MSFGHFGDDWREKASRVEGVYNEGKFKEVRREIACVISVATTAVMEVHSKDLRHEALHTAFFYGIRRLRRGCDGRPLSVANLPGCPYRSETLPIAFLAIIWGKGTASHAFLHMGHRWACVLEESGGEELLGFFSGWEGDTHTHIRDSKVMSG
jgi:hypothetical protein